jgi:hypothetical protein
LQAGVHQVTDERIIPVGKHRRIPHALMEAQNGPVEESSEGPRTDPLALGARGLLILAFVLGSLGTAGTILPGHSGAGLASGRQSDGRFQLLVTVQQVNSNPILPNPWMY